LLPIDWPEPFGLVVIEALACGTPVVAFRRGAMPEILSDSETGFLVEDLEDAVRSVGRIPELGRRACRDAFEARFTATRMARDYMRVYHHLLQDRRRYETCLVDSSINRLTPAVR
jgi:glycosyltransferase involved in cell wall biosynthesis